MTDVWNDRAQAYRDSATHASGDDLDLVVAWCEPGPGVNAVSYTHLTLPTICSV